ncbi:hypothetical protein Micbo1qcDRAFT_198240 [Microdochium bolleyi]|uniref:Uncharacterized protein n=1 Tax=Microdochium bolleyi TaxID=196109 RepID=A0A136INJ4_9PEZI|nr:hypothetical protein Micbo1qcDRAFT_198240 [Microdochium bolleyi]
MPQLFSTLRSHQDNLLPPTVSLLPRIMEYNESSETLSLDSPGQWETEADELCESLGIGAPEYLLGSDQRGVHTAWGYAARLEAIYIAPRYWYSWENKHNAKEATAEELVRKIYKKYYNSEPDPPRKKSKKRSSPIVRNEAYLTLGLSQYMDPPHLVIGNVEHDKESLQNSTATNTRTAPMDCRTGDDSNFPVTTGSTKLYTIEEAVDALVSTPSLRYLVTISSSVTMPGSLWLKDKT